VPLAASFGLRTFHGVRLEKGVQLALVAPVATVVVVVDLFRGQIADGRVTPRGQLHGESGGRTGEQSVGALDGLGKPQALARGADGGCVTDLSDRVLSQRRWVDDVEQAAFEKSHEGHECIGNDFGDQLLNTPATVGKFCEFSLDSLRRGGNPSPSEVIAVLKNQGYVRVREAAALLGVSPNTIRNWGSKEKIPEYRHPVNNHRLFKRTDLQSIMDELEASLKTESRNRKPKRPR